MNRTQSLVCFNKWLHCFTSAERLITQKLHFVFPCGIFLAFALCFNPWNCQIDWEFYSQPRFPKKYQKKKKKEAVNSLEQESFCAPDFLSSPRGHLKSVCLSAVKLPVYFSTNLFISKYFKTSTYMSLSPVFLWLFSMCKQDLRPQAWFFFTFVHNSKYKAGLTLHRSCPGYICQLQQDLTNLYQLQTLLMVFYIHLATRLQKLQCRKVNNSALFPPPTSFICV